MNLTIIFINLMVTISVCYADTIRKQISKIVDLRAVTYFEELEDVYQDLYEKNKKILPWVPSNKKHKIRIKKKLCKKIFNSTYYDMQGEDWLHPKDPANQQKIENSFRNTFLEIYESRYNIFSGERREYINDYRELPIHLSDGRSRKEHLFSCFTTDRNLHQISHYLVSKEYNMTEGMVDASPMAARFVFGFDERNQISLIVMAEESATGNTIVDKTRVTEIYYIGFREHTVPSETPEQDPVCGLSFSHKLRLCASVFASKIFRTKKIKFKPRFSNVERNCFKRPVSFAADISERRRLLLKVSRRELKHNSYEEWMFACNVSNEATTPNEELLYYVSRGDRPHSVFLYFQRFSDSKLYVVNYMKNVSVVDADDRDSFEGARFETSPRTHIYGSASRTNDGGERRAEDVGPSLPRSRTTRNLHI